MAASRCIEAIACGRHNSGLIPTFPSTPARVAHRRIASQLLRVRVPDWWPCLRQRRSKP